MSGFFINNKMFKKSGLDLNTLAKQGGMVKSEGMSEKQRSIFEALDTNKDGVVDNQELQDFANSADAAGKNKKDGMLGNVDYKEAKNFFSNNQATSGMKLSQEDILEFLQSYTNDGSPEDISSAIRSFKNGNELVTITYNNDKQEIINNTKGTITTIDGNKTTEKTKDGKLISETITDANGTTKTEYASDGVNYNKKTETTQGKTVEIEFQDGKETKKTETIGNAQTKEYEKVNGEWRITSETTIKGSMGKEETSYDYNGDTITKTTSEPGGKETIEVKEGDKFISSTEITNKGSANEKKTVTEYKDGTEITTEYNANNKRLSQKVTKDGTTQETKYDGKGNTQVVVNAGESIGIIAMRMSRTTGKQITEEDIYNANPELKKGKMLQAGQTINVPGELETGSAFLKTRQTVEEAKSKANIAEIKKQQNNNSNSDIDFDNIKPTKIRYRASDNLLNKLVQDPKNMTRVEPEIDFMDICTRYYKKTGRGIFEDIINDKSITDESKTKVLNYFVKNSIAQMKSLKPNTSPYICKELELAVQKKNYKAADMILRQLDTSKKETIDQFSNTQKTTWGKISDNDSFAQGLTGDCWLLGPLQSICRTEEGRNYINTYVIKPTTQTIKNADGNSQTVSALKVSLYYKGQKESFVINEKEIAANNHLANGNLNARAIEIAARRMMIEHPDLGNLDGNTANIGYDMLCGKNNSEQFSTSNLDKYFTRDNSSDNNRYKLNKDSVISLVPKDNINVEQNDSGIDSRHSYYIIGKDSRGNYVVGNSWVNPEGNDDPYKNRVHLTPKQMEKYFKTMITTKIV